MERRVFLGISAVAIAALGSGAALAGGDAVLMTAVAKLADLLDTGYVIPAVGKRYATMLRGKVAGGDYAAIADAETLARRLNADLAAVAPDKHLRVVPEGLVPADGRPRPAPGSAPAPGPGPAPGGPRPPQRAAIEDAGWVAPDIAYIRFTGFPEDPAVGAAAEAFMREHATAKAIIIDSRYNGGGGILQMNAMLPYLYPRETVLVQMEVVEAVAKARGGSPFDGDAFVRPTAKTVPGIISSEHYVVPKTDETRLFGAKVFYLVSGRTGSAAEHLALAFKRTKRATLVGEATAGANHFGGFEPIGAGLAVFLPVGRTIDPDTGLDWEGGGIAPDVAVAPTLALEEAIRRARAA
ncbi:MAG: hypothetical protein JWM65_3263 [Sphingomonas bacterium]|nr:hypothetical protein [Sphingomonas bacterium]